MPYFFEILPIIIQLLFGILYDSIWIDYLVLEYFTLISEKIIFLNGLQYFIIGYRINENNKL